MELTSYPSQITALTNELSESQKQIVFGLESIQDEKICCGYDKCFPKRTACPIIVIASLMIDGFIFLNTVFLLTYIFLESNTIDKMDPEEAEKFKRLRTYILKIMLVWWVYYIFYFLKVFHGFKWLLKGRKRIHFIPYYRFAWSVNTLGFLGSLLIILANSFDEGGKTIIEGQVFNICFVVI